MTLGAGLPVRRPYTASTISSASRERVLPSSHPGTRRRFFLCRQDKTSQFCTQGNQGEESLDEIGKERDHVHSKDGMCPAAGAALEQQHLYPFLCNRVGLVIL